MPADRDDLGVPPAAVPLRCTGKDEGVLVSTWGGALGAHGRGDGNRIGRQSVLQSCELWSVLEGQVHTKE